MVKNMDYMQKYELESKLKSKLIAYIILLTLGCTGLHKFYMKQKSYGYVYLGFFIVYILTSFALSEIHSIYPFTSYDVSDYPNNKALASLNMMCFFFLGILYLYDLVKIPSIINAYNDDIVDNFKENQNGIPVNKSDSGNYGLEKLSTLYNLKEKGAITQEEFEIHKKKILEQV